MTSEKKTEATTKATNNKSQSPGVNISQKTLDDMQALFNRFFGDVLEEAEKAIRNSK